MHNTVESLIFTTPPSLTEHPAKVYLKSLAPKSQATMERSLDLIAQLLTNGEADYLSLDWASLRHKHTTAVRAALINNYRPTTVNRILCGLRRVLDEALRLKLISPVDYAHAVNIRSVKVSQKLRGRVLSQDEIDALMYTTKCDLTPCGFRDAALIALLRGAGLRRAEVVNLDLKDFNNDGEIKVLSGEAVVDRTVYLPPTAVAMVNDWIEIRTKAPGPLLCQVNKSLRVVNKRLTPQAVLFILRERCIQAGVEPFSPHDIRHTFASDLLAAGVDVDIVQTLLGHSVQATTKRYKQNKLS